MSLTLKIDTDNAAFVGSVPEMSRLLRIVADKLDNGYMEGALIDANGNKCGFYTVD
jgi:hypothetical protein